MLQALRKQVIRGILLLIVLFSMVLGFNPLSASAALLNNDLDFRDTAENPNVLKSASILVSSYFDIATGKTTKEWKLHFSPSKKGAIAGVLTGLTLGTSACASAIVTAPLAPICGVVASTTLGTVGWIFGPAPEDKS